MARQALLGSLVLGLAWAMMPAANPERDQRLDQLLMRQQRANEYLYGIEERQHYPAPTPMPTAPRRR